MQLDGEAGPWRGEEREVAGKGQWQEGRQVSSTGDQLESGTAMDNSGGIQLTSGQA